jgi:hypothetical protein
MASSTSGCVTQVLEVQCLYTTGLGFGEGLGLQGATLSMSLISTPLMNIATHDFSTQGEQ